jgi:hypothetical protein
MSSDVLNRSLSITEQRFVLPGHHRWDQFKLLEALITTEYPGVRLSNTSA